MAAVRPKYGGNLLAPNRGHRTQIAQRGGRMPRYWWVCDCGQRQKGSTGSHEYAVRDGLRHEREHE